MKLSAPVLTPAVLLVLLLAACGSDGPSGPEPIGPPVRIVTFGDSNTDVGYSGTNPSPQVRSYVSSRATGRLMPTDPNSPLQLVGKIERQWSAIRNNPITAVNHGIAGTTTGGTNGGGEERHSSGAPNARTRVEGVSRFEAEVLGRGRPWSGGEPVNEDFPGGAITRVQAFTPGGNDFAYISMGTNDPANGVSTAQTIANLTWMADQWLAAGLPADHLIMTTLPPRPGEESRGFPAINAAIRALGTTRGIQVIDLAAFTSPDDGRTWRSSELHVVGDQTHYSEAVREWLAARVVEHMARLAPRGS